MRNLALLLLCAGCGRLPAPIVALAESERAPVQAVAVLGPSARTDPAVVADVTRAVRDEQVGLIVLLGDAVRGGRPSAWDDLARRWEEAASAGAAIWLLPAAAEYRGDPRRRAWTAATGAPAGWGTRPLGEGVALVGLESDRRRMGALWPEQQFWIPPALARTESLVVLAPRGPDAGRAIGAALDAAPPHAARAVIVAGDLHALAFPGGSFGAAQVQAGPAAREAGQPAGWWFLRCEAEGALRLSFRPAAPVDPAPVTWRHDPSAGWSPVE